MVSIRNACVEDAAAIAQVHIDSWRTTYAGLLPADHLASLNTLERTSQWNAWLQTGIYVQVAVSNGSIIGFIAGGPIRELLDGYDAELYAVYLLQSSQRCGIGEQLLASLADVLLANSFRSMAAWVLEENPAIHFYKKTGALPLRKKTVEIENTSLTEVAMGWKHLQSLGHHSRI